MAVQRTLTRGTVITTETPFTPRTDRSAAEGAAAQPEHILLIEGDPQLARMLQELLTAQGYAVSTSADVRGALETLQREAIDLAIADLMLEGGGGEKLVMQIRAAFPDVPVIGVTAFGTPEAAAAVTRAGAADYLMKPYRTPALLASIQRVLDETRERRERARERRRPGPFLEGLVGRSRPMIELFERIGRVAHSRAAVLITGETGTGKELVASAVHRASGRGTFVAINCGAIPANLLESELFGHARGAFTGADRDKPGLFEVADGGTLLLDEIGELPLTLQPKLLRVLQSGELRRVGESRTRIVDVRILASTHRDLSEQVEKREFRSDLFFRINVLKLHVPALRERAADIPLLAERFVSTILEREHRPPLRFSRAALAALVAYSWPGNVRELLNVVERATIFADGAEIELDDLADEVRGESPPAAPSDPSRGPAGDPLVRLATERSLTLEELEREYILAVLERTGGNRTRAAELLGIPRRSLYRRLAGYGMSAATA